VPDRVDAEVQAMKPPSFDPSRDREPIQPYLVELADADDAVLGLGKLCEAPIAVWGC
jgi:hypothetical protein